MKNTALNRRESEKLTISIFFGMGLSLMLESSFKANLVKEIKKMFPGCIVFKNEGWQGAPDLLILYGRQWAALETKRSRTATKRPNQEYYIDLLDEMSFAAFIYPENKWEVLDDLERAFTSRRSTRISRC